MHVGNGTSSPDKRRSVRFTPKGARVHARRVGSFFGLFTSKEDVGGEVLDISAHGLRFSASRKLDLNTRLKLVIAFGGGQSITCEAIVKWTHPQSHGPPGRWVAGVEFARLNAGQLAVLERQEKASL